MRDLGSVEPVGVETPERDIQTVTLEIRTLTRQTQQIVLGYAIEIGRRLTEAKGMLPHGEWGRWLREEVEFSQRTANYMMQIFDDLGASQLGLFGPESNSQTLANLPYTKALRLLALPSEEREEFVQEHDVENLSTRELDKLIRERDEAQRKAEEAGALEEALAAIKVDEENMRSELVELERELRELRDRPIDVAVAAADPAELEAAKKEAADAARKETEEQLKKKIETAEQKRTAVEQELAKLKEKQKAAAEHAEALEAKSARERAGMEEELRREKEAAAARIAAMEREMRASKSPEITRFGVHFAAAQESCNKLAECLEALKLAGDAENHNKLLAAYRALAQAMLDGATAEMEEGGERDD